MEESQKLINDAMAGRMSRREFVTKALALGMSVSGITAVLAAVAPSAGARVSGGPSTLWVFLSSPRPTPAPLPGKPVAGNIYPSTSPATGVSRVRFYLDNPTMTGTPRQVENTAPHDF